jgi:type II secretory ATPase GspE/PulE/Tfp pilus assembly ATPase PilB-like protein
MPNQRDDNAAAPGEVGTVRRSRSEGFVEAIRSAGAVAEPLIQWAFEEHRLSARPLHELLAERAPAAEVEIYRALAEFLGVGFEPLAGAKPDEELARYLPSQFALAHNVAPVQWSGGELLVATSQVEMLTAADQVATVVGAPVRMVLGPPSRLSRFMQSFYGLGAETVRELVAGNGETEAPIKLVAPEPVDISEGLDSTQEASVTRFVNQVLIEAVKSRASDIHIEPFEQQLRVRFRIDGVLQEVPVPPAVKQLEQAIISRVKVLGDLDIAEKRLSQDGQIRLMILDRPVDVRVSVLPSIYGESVVLRLLDQQAQFRDLGEIGMPEEMLRRYRSVLSLAQGLVLVTGPTGSGKTTTLYASLNHVNRPGRKIITIEDPVEYRLEGITQVQVKESIGLGFSSLLRSMVRHDPDVIMVGEVRDGVTANMALNSAITGHLVLATLHTNDAPTAVSRLTSMGAPRYMIASALKVVLAQRLVRVICLHCRQPVRDVPPGVLREFPELGGCELHRGRGCEACRHTGYSGRTGIFESFVVTEKMAEMITNGSGTAAVREGAIRHGLVLLRQAGMELVRAGVTTLDEVYRVTRDVAEEDNAGASPPSDGAEAEDRPA